MIEDLAKFWKSEFEGVDIAPDDLKHKYKNRWVRFHSLPESKRYPESEAEYLEVFRRYNTVLQELLGEKSLVFVAFPEYSRSNVPTKPKAELTNLFPISRPWYSVAQHEKDDDYELYWHFHVSEIEFSVGRLNDLFRFVANDDIGNIMIISPIKGVVFHPYDGGADVVLTSIDQKNLIKVRHHNWLSVRPDGL